MRREVEDEVRAWLDRAGLAKATGDVLMILDADLTVMPEALPEFMEAITSGKGELINGSRLLYPIQEVPDAGDHGLEQSDLAARG